MRKIVILHPAHWQQAMGGAELQIRYLVEKLISHGYKVFYIYEDINKPFTNNHKIELLPIKLKLETKRFGDRWVYLKKDVFRYLNKIKPNAIYTRGYSSWSGFATQYAKNNRIPHVLAVASDNSLKTLVKKVSILKPLDIITKRLMNFSIKNCNYVLVQNKFQSEYLLKYHNRKGILVTQSSKLVENSSDLIKQNKTLEVLWVANLKPIKQPEIFLDIVKEFRDDVRVNFYMLGRFAEQYGDKLTELSTLTNFEYLGEVENDKVNKLLEQSHVLINTSVDEGFSNTFVQAWLRKVVVISMNSNPDYILTNLGIGYLSETKNKVVEILEILLENKLLLGEMAEKSYKYATKYHDIEKNLDVVISLLTKDVLEPEI